MHRMNQVERQSRRDDTEAERRAREVALDATIAGTFPASDPASSDPNPPDPDAAARIADDREAETPARGSE
jgi:hypothetical protein